MKLIIQFATSKQLGQKYLHQLWIFVFRDQMWSERTELPSILFHALYCGRLQRSGRSEVLPFPPSNYHICDPGKALSIVKLSRRKCCAFTFWTPSGCTVVCSPARENQHLQFSCSVTDITLKKQKPRFLSTSAFESSSFWGHETINNSSFLRRESQETLLLFRE